MAFVEVLQIDAHEVPIGLVWKQMKNMIYVVNRDFDEKFINETDSQ